MYEIIEEVEPYMPKDKPRYLIGSSVHQVNIIEAVYRGVDLFDCVMPKPKCTAAAICLPGRASSTSTMQNMSWMTVRLMQSVTVRFVSVIPALISVICSKQTRCWACVLLLCITCILVYPDGRDPCSIRRGRVCSGSVQRWLALLGRRI